MPGESIILDAHEDFFIEGRPYLDRIVFKINPDTASAMIEMENGDLDLWSFVSNSRDIASLTENPEINITDEGYAAVGAINWLAFNTQHEILGDVRVRQAIAYAIDRDFITEALHGGFSRPAYGPIHGDSPFASDNIERYDLDLDRANELLDEAGFPADGDGNRFSLTVDFIPGPIEQQQNVAEYLKSQLTEVGIEIEVRAAPDFPTWAGRVSSYDFDLTMDILFNWGDPVIGVHRTYLSTNIVEGVHLVKIPSNMPTPKWMRFLTLPLANLTRMHVLPSMLISTEIVGAELPVYWINTLPNWTASQQWVHNVPVSIWGTMAPMG